MDALSKLLVNSNGGHSSAVGIWLHACGKTFEVLQSGEQAIKLARGTSVPAGAAILEVTIDGRPHRRQIQIVSKSSDTGWFAIS